MKGEMETDMDMKKIDDKLKWSHLFLINSYFSAYPPILKNLPISQAKKLLKKKPFLVHKFADRLVEKLDKDVFWIARDMDLLQEKISNLPYLILKSSTAKRAFQIWQRAVHDRGPLGLEKSTVYYRKVLLALLESSGVTVEEKNTIEAALTFESEGTMGLVRQFSKNYLIEDIWRLPNGKRMRFSSEFEVAPYKDEKEGEGTPWINRIPDIRPYNPEGIAAQNAYNCFDLKGEVENHPSLTRLEKQILLFKCEDDVSLGEIANELRKSIKSVERTFYTARKKMDKWLEVVGMKEILQNPQLQSDHLLFNPPPHKVVRLPSLWDDFWVNNPSPVREWFDREEGQDFLMSLIPPDEGKPFCWRSTARKRGENLYNSMGCKELQEEDIFSILKTE